MKTPDYYKKLFFVGSLWNMGAAILFMIASLFIPSMFDLFGTEEPTNYVWFYLFFAMVFTLGMGYYWVSSDINQNHALVKTGLIAKILFFLIMLGYTISGDFNWLVMAPASIDLIFAILFIEFLKNYKIS